MQNARPERPIHFDGVTLRLRELILSGEFPAASKLRETHLATLLGVSRTPVRLALGILAREGLLDHEPRRGFSVREVTFEQIFAAFDVRGALEALAAKALAVRGLDRGETSELEDCLADGAALLRQASFDGPGSAAWTSMNGRLHAGLVRMAGSRPVADAIAFNGRLPLVSPGAIAFCQGQIDLAFTLMEHAQRQHVEIVESIQRRQVDRAQTLVVEHAYQSREYLKQLLAGAQTTRELQRAMQRLRATSAETRVAADAARAGHMLIGSD